MNPVHYSLIIFAERFYCKIWQKLCSEDVVGLKQFLLRKEILIGDAGRRPNLRVDDKIPVYIRGGNLSQTSLILSSP